MSDEHEHGFQCLGSEIRLLIGPATRSDVSLPKLAALELEAFLRVFHRRLTRFDPTSELSALNVSTQRSCAVSPLLAAAVGAGIWAAERSAGLVDPTLLSELERAGYERSRVGVAPASLDEALSAAPPRRPASARADSRWRKVSVQRDGRVVTRPPGVRLDSGGIGKGLAADLCAGRLSGYASFAVDAGGDVRIGGERPQPRQVTISSPLGETVASFWLTRGAVATSGISTRIWRRGDGFAHHLLDPSTGEPAWTGVVQATAIADTALAAETLAKVALLSGPERGARLLEPGGGLLVLDGGELVEVDSLAEGGSLERKVA